MCVVRVSLYEISSKFSLDYLVFVAGNIYPPNSIFFLILYLWKYGTRVLSKEINNKQLKCECVWEMRGIYECIYVKYKILIFFLLRHVSSCLFAPLRYPLWPLLLDFLKKVSIIIYIWYTSKHIMWWMDGLGVKVSFVPSHVYFLRQPRQDYYVLSLVKTFSTCSHHKVIVIVSVFIILRKIPWGHKIICDFTTFHGYHGQRCTWQQGKGTVKCMKCLWLLFEILLYFLIMYTRVPPFVFHQVIGRVFDWRPLNKHSM